MAHDQAADAIKLVHHAIDRLAPGVITRVTVPLPARSGLSCAGNPVLHMQAKDSPIATSYYGEALVYTGSIGILAAVDACLQQFPEAVIVGGLMFPRTRHIVSDVWSGYDAVRLFVPKLEWAYHTRTGESIGTAFLWLSENEEKAALKHAYSQLLAACYQPRPQSLTRLIFNDATYAQPTQAQFEAFVRDTIATLSPSFTKVVLATVAQYTLACDADSRDLFQAICNQATGTHRVLWQLDKTRAFMSVSPERLFYRDKSDLCVDALAGTRPIGRTQAETDYYAAALLASEKERHEHAIVCDYTQRQLDLVCQVNTVRVSPIQVYPQARVQHLYQAVTGTLTPTNQPNYDCIRHLFPTPAVAGYPLADALAYIQAHEPLDRGLYGGVIARLTHTTSDYIVAIRALQQVNQTISVYTGTGIVAGSIPALEWQEHCMKRQSILQAFSD